MFTGLIQACVPVRGWELAGAGARLRLPAPDACSGALLETPFAPDPVAPGESLAVSGCCLTVAGFADEAGRPSDAGPAADLVFDLSAETLERTWFGELVVGRLVNLERSLRMGDRLGGHLVSGHVDGRGRVTAIEESGDGGKLFRFEVDAGLERYLIEKGSVGLDGISLTVVEPKGRSFSVAVIPKTLELTSLGAAQVGQRLNVEVDAVGKWIERLFPGRE
jgi:riboflavin synthase